MAATFGILIEAAVFQFSIDTSVSLAAVLGNVRSLVEGLKVPATSAAAKR